jgi:hypothetical protein
MNYTLASLLRKCVLVFFDDILVYIQSYEDHLLHLEQVLQLLQKEQWMVKGTKCSFTQRSIPYLGYVISAAGVSTSEDKIQAVANWPTPTNVKQLRSFVGLAGYYKKFMKHFVMISKPLTELLKKDQLFVWINDQELAFQTLKSALVQAHVLTLPDFQKQFSIKTDAYDLGVGAVLMQEGHPVAFVSKALGTKLRGLYTYEKEYVAVLLDV